MNPNQKKPENNLILIDKKPIVYKFQDYNPEAKVFMPDVAPEIIQAADKILLYIAKQDQQWDYAQWLTDNIPPNESAIAIQNTLKAIKEYKKTHIVEVNPSLIAASTGAVRVASGVGYKDGLQAIKLLKQQHRIVQVGKGKGVALIVLDANPLQSKNPIQAEESKPELETLLDSISRYCKGLENQLEEQRKVTIAKSAEIAKLVEKTKELEQELSVQQMVTTWS